MALVVEDGTGLTTADSYISLVDADAYLRDYGPDGLSWFTEPAARREKFLRRAAGEMDDQHTYRGRKLTSTQALEWPRTGGRDDRGDLIDSASVPDGVRNAQALRAADIARRVEEGADELVEDLDQSVTSRTFTFGPISETSNQSGSSSRMPRLYMSVITSYIEVGVTMRG